MEPKQSVKELQEVISALLLISLRVADVLKDGYQPADLTALLAAFTKDEGFKKAIGDAYDGISKVSGELKDLDAAETVQLSVAVLQFIPRFIDVFKEKVPA